MVLQVWLDVETYHEVVAMLEIYASLSEKQLCEQGIYSDGEQRGKKIQKTGEEKQMVTAWEYRDPYVQGIWMI